MRQVMDHGTAQGRQNEAAHEPQRRRVSVGDAVLSTLVAGPTDGPPVVLLHGMPASAELWRNVLPRLAEAGYRAWAPDLPGYGGTRLPKDGDHSVAGAAELMAVWLRGEDLADGETPGRPVWLVGHDLGGAAAQILVARHSELVSRLTLGDTVAEDSWPVTPVRIFRALARLGLYPALAAMGLVPNPYAWRELRKGFSNPARCDRPTAERVFWEGKARDPQGRRAFARHLASLDPAQTVEAAPRLRDLRIPVLLLWGKDDVFQTWEEVGERLRALLPDPDVKVVEGAGHFFPLERPKGYSEALLEWVE